MNAVSDFIVSKETLERAHITADELAVEIATHLYATKRMNMGQARRLANLDLMSFQSELAKRNIFLHYGVADLEDDLETLARLDKKFSK
jgi:predicted HTH domain antitoxin